MHATHSITQVSCKHITIHGATIDLLDNDIQLSTWQKDQSSSSPRSRHSDRPHLSGSGMHSSTRQEIERRVYRRIEWTLARSPANFRQLGCCSTRLVRIHSMPYSRNLISCAECVVGNAAIATPFGPSPTCCCHSKRHDQQMTALRKKETNKRNLR